MLNDVSMSGDEDPQDNCHMSFPSDAPSVTCALDKDVVDIIRQSAEDNVVNKSPQ